MSGLEKEGVDRLTHSQKVLPMTIILPGDLVYKEEFTFFHLDHLGVGTKPCCQHEPYLEECGVGAIEVGTDKEGEWNGQKSERGIVNNLGINTLLGARSVEDEVEDPV